MYGAAIGDYDTNISLDAMVKLIDLKKKKSSTNEFFLLKGTLKVLFLVA